MNPYADAGVVFGIAVSSSSACSGNLNLEEARGLVDRDGIGLPDALRQVGLDFERVKECGRELQGAAAYLELHIEQGPVLLDLGLPLGTVLGTYGVERHAITFHGQAAHSGSTPMNRRRDAFLAAARMGPEIYRIADHRMLAHLIEALWLRMAPFVSRTRSLITGDPVEAWRLACGHHQALLVALCTERRVLAMSLRFG